MQNVTASPVNNNVIMVKWETPADGGFDGFEVKVENQTISVMNNMTTEINVMNLSAGSNHSVIVRSIFMNVSSEPASVETFTCKCVACSVFSVSSY